MSTVPNSRPRPLNPLAEAERERKAIAAVLARHINAPAPRSAMDAVHTKFSRPVLDAVEFEREVLAHAAFLTRMGFTR